MKKAAILAAALAMVLSMAACGNRDDNAPDDQNNSGVMDHNGVNNNGSLNGDNTPNGSGSPNNGSLNNGSAPGGPNDNGITGPGTGGSLDNHAAPGSGGAAADGSTGSTGLSRAGSAVRRAADDVGDAVTGMVEGGRSAVARGTSTTTFQRMLDNARVHDVDGVLTDGENSRW